MASGKPDGHEALLRNKTVEKAETFHVRHSSDGGQCFIESAQFLDDGRLVMTDSNNKKVKITYEALPLQSVLKLPDEPYGLAIITQKKAVVTQPMASKVQFIGLSPRLDEGPQVKTRVNCRGVVCYNEILYLSCLDLGRIAVLVMDVDSGKEIRTIKTSVSGEYPNCIAVDRRGRLYISDSGENLVLSLTRRGDVLFKYTDKSLEYPMSIFLDTDCSVLVCGSHSNNVQLISDTGTKIKDMVTPGEGGVDRPAAVAYRASDRTLVVAMWQSEKMAVFRLT